jgi:hypothetical protein
VVFCWQTVDVELDVGCLAIHGHICILQYMVSIAYTSSHAVEYEVISHKGLGQCCIAKGDVHLNVGYGSEPTFHSRLLVLVCRNRPYPRFANCAQQAFQVVALPPSIQLGPGGSAS